MLAVIMGAAKLAADELAAGEESGDGEGTEGVPKPSAPTMSTFLVLLLPEAADDPSAASNGNGFTDFRGDEGIICSLVHWVASFSICVDVVEKVFEGSFLWTMS